MIWWRCLTLKVIRRHAELGQCDCRARNRRYNGYSMIRKTRNISKFRISCKFLKRISYLLLYLTISQFSLFREHSRNIFGRRYDKRVRYLSCEYVACRADLRKKELTDLRDGASTILRIASKQNLHLLLITSFLAFHKCLAHFFRYVVESRHDDVFFADLGRHGVEHPSFFI